MFTVFFIGGPLNNQLVRVANLPWVLRVPVPYPPDELETLAPYAPMKCVDYYPDGQLPTGVPVYSCLWGSDGRPRRGTLLEGLTDEQILDLMEPRAKKPPARQE